MSTWLWILVGFGAYVVFAGGVLGLLRIAKDSDQFAERQVARAIPRWAAGPRLHSRAIRRGVEASSHWLARRTADAQTVLGVERIAVLLRDTTDISTWVVEACGGVTGLCGATLVGDRPSPVALLTDEGEEERGAWRTLSTPIVVDGVVVGEISAATRRARGFGSADRDLLDRFAALLAGRVPTLSPSVGGAAGSDDVDVA